MLFVSFYSDIFVFFVIHCNEIRLRLIATNRRTGHFYKNTKLFFCTSRSTYGGGSTTPSPRKLSKQPPPLQEMELFQRSDCLMPNMVGKLATNSTHYIKGLVKTMKSDILLGSKNILYIQCNILCYYSTAEDVVRNVDYMAITYSRVWINRVGLPILLVVVN